MSNFTEKAEKTHVVLLHETWRQSAARDITTAAVMIGLWSFGWYVGSPALEWTGVILGLIFVFARGMALFKRNMDSRMTPDQARKWFDAAGLPDRSSHGVRKALAEFLAEAGCTQHQIMAILSHTQAKTSEIYTRAADRRALAGSAAQAMGAIKW